MNCMFQEVVSKAGKNIASILFLALNSTIKSIQANRNFPFKCQKYASKL